LINKTLAQMNAERAIRRTQPGFCLTYGHNLKLKNRSRSASASCKPQAASAIKKPQMIFKTILEFEK